MYTGWQTEYATVCMLELFKLADKYHVVELITTTQDIIAQQLSVATWCDTIDMANIRGFVFIFIISHYIMPTNAQRMLMF
jgi:hypothetical protein